MTFLVNISLNILSDLNVDGTFYMGLVTDCHGVCNL